MANEAPPPYSSVKPPMQGYQPVGYAPPPGPYPQQPSPYPQQPSPYPQQPGYGPPSAYPVQGYPQPVSHQTTVITQQPQVMLPIHFGEFPVPMSCPHCRAQIVSATTYDVGSLTWVVAGVLFVVGCWPCCLFPFCMDGCKDVTHSCPNCHRVLGVFQRM